MKTCWQCKEVIETPRNFCPYCGAVLGEVIEHHSAQRGMGYAKILKDGNTFEMTFQGGKRRTLEKIA